MKRFLILPLLAIVVFGAHAQAQEEENQGQRSAEERKNVKIRGNYIGISADGGLSTLLYNPTHGDQESGFGYGASIHFTRFVVPHLGFRIGLNYMTTQSVSVYNFKDVSNGMIHPDNPNVHYNLTTTFDGWRERQTLAFLGIPVEFLWRTNMGRGFTFMAGLGAQLDLNLVGKYTANEGQYTTSGYFDVLGYEVTNLPTHGFSAYDANFESDLQKLPASISLLADAGIRYQLKGTWGLYVGVYACYGLNNLVDKHSTLPLLSLDMRNSSQTVYNGTFASNEVDALHLFRAGVKLTIDWGWMEIIHDIPSIEQDDVEEDMDDENDEETEEQIIDEGTEGKEDSPESAEDGE